MKGDFVMSRKMKYKVGDEFPNRKRLTKYVGSHPKFRTSLWMWECMDCGKPGGPSLTNSITRTKRPACCYQSRSGSEAGRWKGFKELTGVFLGSYEAGARKRGLVWQVTPEQLWDLWITQDGKCAYTGRKLKHGVDASIDRIDNKRGYLPDNVQWVHRDINRMKSDFDADHFIKLCREVAKHS
jgi:hypothetical protein